jgi:hypothetical protein
MTTFSAHDRVDGIASRQARRIKNVGTGGGERFQPAYRIGQVGPTGDQILRARGEDERKRQCPRRCHGGGDALNRQRERIDRVARSARRVFDGAADQPCGHGHSNGLGARLRVVAEPVLEIRRHG